MRIFFSSVMIYIYYLAKKAIESEKLAHKKTPLL